MGIIQTIQADGMKVKVLRGEPPGYSQAELYFLLKQIFLRVSLGILPLSISLMS